MKRISDYKDGSAIELWADLLEPLGAIFADEKVIEVMNGKQSVMKIVSTIFKTHKEEAKEFISGLNLKSHAEYVECVQNDLKNILFEDASLHS